MPHFQGLQPLTVFPHLGSDSLNNSWHPYASLPQRASPRHLLSSPQTPSIRVTGTAESQQFAPPHTEFASFGSIYQPSRQPQASPLNLNTAFDYSQQQYMMGPLSPDATMQVQQMPVKQRTSSMTSNSNIPTPVSIAGPRSPLLSPTAVTAGERRHTNHSRNRSTDSSEQDDEDDGTLRKNYSYKRAEEPQRNQDGKMMCRHQECAGLFFDRKCEWR